MLNALLLLFLKNFTCAKCYQKKFQQKKKYTGIRKLRHISNFPWRRKSQ